MSDSKTGIISKRYAQALIEIVKGGKLSYEEVTKNLAIIDNTLNLSQDLDEFLSNPLMPIDDKKSTFDEVFNSEISPFIKNFVYILLDKNRFNLFKDIEMAYLDLLDEINNILKVEIISAIDLTAENKQKTEEKLSKKLNSKIFAQYKTDAEIIAGLVIKIGDNIIDTSLKHKLEKMEEIITK